MSVNNHNRNGSIMIAALILTLITGSLVGLFLTTVTREVEYSHRARMAFQSINVAEAGLEHAIYALNEVKDVNWPSIGWTAKGNGYYREISFPLIYNTWLRSKETRRARVFFIPNVLAPIAMAEGIIDIGNGMQVKRQVYIELGPRSPFANGVLARDTIKFNGNGIYVDSYISRPTRFRDWETGQHPYYDEWAADPSNSAYHYAYKQVFDWSSGGDGTVDSTKVNLLDGGTVATISIDDDVLTLGNAGVWGRVGTRGDNPTVLKNGFVKGEDTPNGVRVDPNRVSLDFYANIPDVRPPTYTSPRSSISYDSSTDEHSIGTNGTKTYYKFSDFEVKDYPITVYGNVEMLVTDDVLISNQKLILDANASIKMYVGDDFTISGNQSSIVNPTALTERLIVYSYGKDDPSTSDDETPEFILAGNGAFYGAVYAPNADIELNGSGNAGEMFGAIVGKTITFGGGYQFHYDEALAEYVDNQLRKVTRWVELTDAEERQNMAPALN